MTFTKYSNYHRRFMKGWSRWYYLRKRISYVSSTQTTKMVNFQIFHQRFILALINDYNSTMHSVTSIYTQTISLRILSEDVLSSDKARFITDRHHHTLPPCYVLAARSFASGNNHSQRTKHCMYQCNRFTSPLKENETICKIKGLSLFIWTNRGHWQYSDQINPSRLCITSKVWTKALDISDHTHRRRCRLTSHPTI